MSLPPGQRQADGFPRFGTHFHHRPPAVPDDPAIEISGAGIEPFAVALTELKQLPRLELDADFHCVAGWSATGLRWEGVPLVDFYRLKVEPALEPGVVVSHLAFVGLDGYRSIATLRDALAGDVLLAERLNGAPLCSDHGAPVRLLSPSQYGYISTKHLCRIELHVSPPVRRYHPSWPTQLGLKLVEPHPRARVLHEERHRHLPAALLRHPYRLLIPPIKLLSARGGRVHSGR